MKVGVIGPAGMVDKICRIMTRKFPQMLPVNCHYRAYTEAPAIVKYQQPFLDALLFAGTTPYVLTQATVKPTIPWHAIPRDGSSLLRVLLEASLLRHYDIRRVTCDSYEEDSLYETYEEIGLEKNALHLHLAARRPCDADYLTYLWQFHMQRYLHHDVSCCLTALESVYEQLCAHGVACVKIEPTIGVITETLHKLQLTHQLRVSEQNQIVAVCIQVDTPHEYSLFSDNEYQYVIDKMKIAKHIYLFAQRLQAAVTEVGHQEYLLFSTRQALEQETSNLEQIDLLAAVKNDTANTISVGIGYGRTAREARHNAHVGMLRASKSGGDMAFIVYSDKKILGPLHSRAVEDKPTTIDARFLDVSERTGISINTVFRLYSVMQQRGQDSFTAGELAACLGVTLRTMNRLINKLEIAGYCQIIGKRSLTNTGRPSRIIRLQLAPVFADKPR